MSEATTFKVGDFVTHYESGAIGKVKYISSAEPSGSYRVYVIWDGRGYPVRQWDFELIVVPAPENWNDIATIPLAPEQRTDVPPAAIPVVFVKGNRVRHPSLGSGTFIEYMDAPVSGRSLVTWDEHDNPVFSIDTDSLTLISAPASNLMAGPMEVRIAVLETTVAELVKRVVDLEIRTMPDKDIPDDFWDFDEDSSKPSHSDPRITAILDAKPLSNADDPAGLPTRDTMPNGYIRRYVDGVLQPMPADLPTRDTTLSVDAMEVLRDIAEGESTLAEELGYGPDSTIKQELSIIEDELEPKYIEVMDVSEDENRWIVTTEGLDALADNETTQWTELILRDTQGFSQTTAIHISHITGIGLLPPEQPMLADLKEWAVNGGWLLDDDGPTERAVDADTLSWGKRANEALAEPPHPPATAKLTKEDYRRHSDTLIGQSIKLPQKLNGKLHKAIRAYINNDNDYDHLMDDLTMLTTDDGWSVIQEVFGALGEAQRDGVKLDYSGALHVSDAVRNELANAGRQALKDNNL